MIEKEKSRKQDKSSDSLSNEREITRTGSNLVRESLKHSYVAEDYVISRAKELEKEGNYIEAAKLWRGLNATIPENEANLARKARISQETVRLYDLAGIGGKNEKHSERGLGSSEKTSKREFKGEIRYDDILKETVQRATQGTGHLNVNGYDIIVRYSSDDWGQKVYLLPSDYDDNPHKYQGYDIPYVDHLNPKYYPIEGNKIRGDFNLLALPFRIFAKGYWSTRPLRKAARIIEKEAKKIIRERKRGDLEARVGSQVAVATSILFLISTIFFSINNITGNVIGLNSNSNILGVVTFLIGCLGAFIYLKMK